MLNLIRRELMLAFRAGSGVALGLSFFLIVVVISALGLGRDPELLARAAPGVIWSAALLATLLSLDRLFQTDFEDGSLEALMQAPIPAEAMVLSKIIAHWLTTGLPLILVSPLMAIMLNLPFSLWGTLILSLFAGLAGLSAIGAVGAGLTLGIRRGGLLLSLLTMPLYVPSLIFGVLAVQNHANGISAGTPLLLASGITLFSIVLAPIAAAAAIRVHLRN